MSAIVRGCRTASDGASSTESTEETAYTVVQGDTLWGLAKKFLGRGNRYKEIMAANNMTDTILRPGMVLMIPSC